MKAERNQRHAAFSWVLMGLLGALATVFGFFQYRWIGELSRAEQVRLRAGLETSLYRLSQDFNAEVTAACADLMPSYAQVEQAGREGAYAARYVRWRENGRHAGLFRRIALVTSERGKVSLQHLDLNANAFGPGEWPAEWNALRDRMTARFSPDPLARRPPPGFAVPEEAAIIEVPRFTRPFGASPGGGPRPPSRTEPPAARQRTERMVRMERPEAEFLVLEIDIPYALDVLLPSLLERHLGGRAKEDYDVEVVAAGDPSRLIHASGPGREPHIAALADASVRIFDVQYDRIFRRLAPRLPPEAAPGAVTSGARPPGAPPSPDSGGRGRWQLSVRHRAGSIEAVVTRARWRNLAVSTAILGLMLATIAALVQFTRRANRLAKLQMEFVTSVSHELRTPLSVIRTAGHNLGAGVVRDDKQVRRYGSLIRDQAERLTGIVEQVLLFANVRAGRAIGAREPCSVQAVVEDAMAVLSAALESSRCRVETSIEAGLPPVMADPLALRHALQNLLANAANYGAEGGWIGVSASAVTGEADARVEIRVSDRGPGIPAGEIPMIFDPFFRGKRAIEDQLHGTGLGLSLVKRIVEAHGGTVSVNSKLGAGAEFVISLPAVPEDQINEFADSPDRG